MTNNVFEKGSEGGCDTSPWRNWGRSFHAFYGEFWETSNLIRYHQDKMTLNIDNKIKNPLTETLVWIPNHLKIELLPPVQYIQKNRKRQIWAFSSNWNHQNLMKPNKLLKNPKVAGYFSMLNLWSFIACNLKIIPGNISKGRKSAQTDGFFFSASSLDNGRSDKSMGNRKT